ncbi:MAG TPA: O-methyltransferase [Bacteroidales bacterium]|jgi:predicted O-methyltransferase YrrM|nr:O-methyltransferase [Bacteroidales bacterium]MDD4235200.1 O-methyltransferase [Bacteroidales bacterium]MDY0159941.1 O-methyltransferase [Bacteroidales bacterium]HXK82284.1 O-methyltransferase [Bacteroidales bacterium]
MNTDIYNYIESVSSKEDKLLYNLRRETNLVTVHPRMLCGIVQGKFLEFIVSMLKPKNVLEIGSFTAYSTICIARGLSENAKLISLEKNDEINWIAQKYVGLSGLEDKIELITADALLWMNKTTTMFDMIYIDGDKREYPNYYKRALKLLNKNGFIIADNVLWDNKVLADITNNDKMLDGIKEFNKMVSNDNTVEKVLLPVRDGIFLIKKI